MASIAAKDLLGRADRICQVLVGEDRDDIMIESDAVGIFTFDQDHSDRRRRQRHTEYDVHYPSKILSCVIRFVFRAGCARLPD